jgi:transposase-like protein
MKQESTKRSSLVLGPDGTVLALTNLPTNTRIRWVPRRKAEVVAAVNGGLLTMAEACDRYAISLEEFMQWKRDYEERGLVGLLTPSQRRLKVVH